MFSHQWAGRKWFVCWCAVEGKEKKIAFVELDLKDFNEEKRSGKIIIIIIVITMVE